LKKLETRKKKIKKIFKKLKKNAGRHFIQLYSKKTFF